MTNAQQNETAAELLRRTKVEVAPATFVLVGMRHEDWTRLLEQPELSPRAAAPFMLLRDQYEVTLLVEEEDWLVMRHAVRDARVETNWRLVTLDIELGWNVTGYLARVTEILAAASVPVGALTAFSRDHLLIKQDDLGTALRVLGEHVAELC
ncbi:MAG TPA: ACT domain-containing protein [Pyrinomonadaceae bacterium]|nr:ACT domain-containing protein [Pyrinomonadaceae bacterium]